MYFLGGVRTNSATVKANWKNSPIRNELFGPDQTIDTQEGRLLTTDNKRGAAQYRTAASRNIISNQILHQLHAIEKSVKENFSSQVIAAFEAVDTDLHTILLTAEKTIAKHSHIPWSPELHQAYQIWKYKFQCHDFNQRFLCFATYLYVN